MPSFSINVRLGIWLDDLRLGIKQGLKTSATIKPEAAGLDAFGPEVAPRILSSSGRRDLAQHLRGKGAVLAALRADVGGRRLADPNTLDVNLSRLREAMQLAADLGAPYLIVPGGYIPPSADKENARLRVTLGEAARALAGLGSSLRTRICWEGGNEAPEILAEFLAAEDPSGIIAVDLNPGGYVMRGIEPLKALNLLSARVNIARAVDHYRGGAEAPFGQGDVRWGEVLIGLATLKRAVSIDVLAGCGLEGDSVRAITAAYKRLQVLRANPVG